jgi:alpha-tubulin suppressor-like RCC1 family protein
MFGKDTTHTSPDGLVTKLQDEHIIKVCLGKAHCVVLNSAGEIFSFGLNNKYQCGHLPNKGNFFKLKLDVSSIPEEIFSFHQNQSTFRIKICQNLPISQILTLKHF